LDAAPGLLPHAGEKGRLASLDLLRGVAVLGILAINIGGFAGPIAATLSPNQLEPGTFADEAAWAFALVVFEGKMRALFTLLFGASLVLFMERADRRGLNGERLQFRRLGWLALAGYLHFLLLWWGDILFTYALAGFAALAFRQAPPHALGAGALALFAGWHLLLAVASGPDVAREERVLSGHASPGEAVAYALVRDEVRADTQREVARDRMGFAAQVAAKWREEPSEPVSSALAGMGETLPLMLLGMALYRSGFFSGGWSTRALRVVAWGGIGIGGAMALALAAWMWGHGFPPRAMFAMLATLSAPEHLAMALGYAAALLLLWPRLCATPVACALAAAGRCAFTNYLGTTVLMGLVFSGWGLGLGPEMPRGLLPLFVVTGWAAMLAWPRWWLARHAAGPMETLWRWLTWWGGRPVPPLAHPPRDAGA